MQPNALPEAPGSEDPHAYRLSGHGLCPALPLPVNSLPIARLGVIAAVILAGGAFGCSSSSDDDNHTTNDHNLTSTEQKTNPTAPATPPGAAPPGDAPPAPGMDPNDDPNAEPESGDQPGTLSQSYKSYDVNHIILTGQSNSVANGGSPYLTTTQPDSNVMFDTGVMPVDNCTNEGCTTYQTPSSFIPLVEGDHFFNYQVETPASGIGNGISYIAAQRYGFGGAGAPAKSAMLLSVNGRSGNTLWCIRKGGCPYQNGIVRPFDQAMRDITNAKQIATAQGKTYVVRGVTMVHGESDHYGYSFGTPEFPNSGSDGTPGKIKDYADGLIELQQDYDTSVKATSGQTENVPLFISQISGWTDRPTSPIATAQYEAHVRSAGKVVLVAPAYPLSVQTDCLHYDANGYRRLGEYFAKAYARVVFENKPWEPVRPRTITKNGNVITVKYYVPKLPLTFDTQKVTDPGNYGYGFSDDGGATITAVELAGPDSVKITLSKAPGANARLRYALNQPANSCIGPGTTYGGGARGNLRDSDDTPSRYGYALENWGVQFDLAVP